MGRQLDATSEFRCRNSPAFADRGCPAVGDPSASLEQQAAFIGTAVHGTKLGYIHEADFIKWRELSLTFAVPQRFQTSDLLRGASLTLAGRNLATWTDYPGMDPEIAESGTGNFNQNEFNTQPPVRYWTWSRWATLATSAWGTDHGGDGWRLHGRLRRRAQCR